LSKSSGHGLPRNAEEGDLEKKWSRGRGSVSSTAPPPLGSASSAHHDRDTGASGKFRQWDEVSWG
jgi:hypothetical protein